MANSLSVKFCIAATKHPRGISAAWFEVAALPLVFPVIGMMFLILVVNSLPIWTGITFLLSVTLLPLTITALAGFFIGPRILSLPPGKNPTSSALWINHRYSSIHLMDSHAGDHLQIAWP